jgi:ABC-type nitrate/sulfonate/bicarbonate transport system ATPase subunit
MAAMTGLEIDIIRKHYPSVGGGPARLVFEEFHLAVEPRTFVCLLGPSGVGKTTLLNMVAGLDRDYVGRITFGGKPESRIGYVFQSPRLLPWRTVLENIVLPQPAGDAARRSALALLAEMGMSDTRDVYPERLSLGMQRRVALARAFAVDPNLLLMDEPFVSLDEATADRLRDLLIGMLALRPATVLFVTHDSRDAVRLADRIVVLSGPPVRIAKDIGVFLSRQERKDAKVIEAFRGHHIALSLNEVAVTV